MSNPTPPSPLPTTTTTKKHFPTSINITPDAKKSSFSSSSSSSFVIRRSIGFAYGYGFTFAFVAFTIFFVFNNYSSPVWFKNRSPQFSTLFSHFFPSISSSSPKVSTTRSHSPTLPFSQENDGFPGKINSSSKDKNAIANSSSQYAKIGNIKGFEEENTVPNDGFLLKKERDEVKQRKEDWLDLMNHCNIYNGSWVRDDSYPLYQAGSCPHIDEQFNCFLNGRLDNKFENFMWQPSGCNIPRLNGTELLELLRGKRLVYVGDSLNRNMWESMVCILRNAVEDKSKVFEASGRHEFRGKDSYSFLFADYNFSVEFFRSSFLVQEWEIDYINGSKKSTLRLDVLGRSSDRYKSANVLVFNTGHWWTRGRTSRGKGYFQEGSHIYSKLNVIEAFRKAVMTWARWIDANIDPEKTLVFFRAYSSAHFRGGQWNSGGQCDGELEPIKNAGAYLSEYPQKMRVLEGVIKGMKTPVFYLNVTRMTDYRKDAHPSIYRKQNLTEEERLSSLRFQDCSHWCLPGVPDSWNELLYVQLLMKYNKEQQQQH